MGWLTELLKDYPALPVAHERIALAEEKYATLEVENKQLKEENARLADELVTLRRLIPNNDFVERRGALFKRKPDGTFDDIAYCPDCKRALSTIENFFPPRCSKCKFQAPFKRDEIPGILQELRA
jgi:hypothetical protein